MKRETIYILRLFKILFCELWNIEILRNMSRLTFPLRCYMYKNDIYEKLPRLKENTFEFIITEFFL